MASDLRLPSPNPSASQLLRLLHAPPHQPVLLPYELRPHRPHHPLPLTLVAPDLPHRLPRHVRRLALPLLPPGGAARRLRQGDRRSHRADGAVRADDRFPALD
ncbi:hypothetical protein Dimus_004200 [Dionaea muscipula]